MQMWEPSLFNWSLKPWMRKSGPWTTCGELTLEKLLEEEKPGGKRVKGSKEKEENL